MLDFSFNGDRKFTVVPKPLRIDNGVFKILGLTAEYPALPIHIQNIICGYVAIMELHSQEAKGLCTYTAMEPHINIPCS